FACADTGSVKWIKKIHIERCMKARRAARRNRDCLFNHGSNPALIKFSHCKNADTHFPNEIPLTWIHAAGSNDRSIFRKNFWRKTGNMCQLFWSMAQKGSKRHSMYVAGRAGLRRIDVRVCIQPDDSDFLISLVIVGCDT